MKPVIALPLWLALVSVAVSALTLVSVADEITIGRQAQQDVRKQVPELADRGVVGYVAGIGRRLAARAGGPKYPYSFSIADYKELNAFALPGGPVWIHRGVIDAAANESQLAGVVAHEIAHIARRHAAGQITKNLVANGLLGLLGAALGNDRSARAAQIGAQALAGGYMLKFSRDDERDADAAGAQIMRRAGWDPRGMIEFMETLHRQQGRDPGSVEVFLSTHPAPGERAARLRRQLGRAGGGRRDSAEFQRARARVRSLAPAHAMKR